MKIGRFILKTKLTPPQMKKQILQRAALNKKLRRIPDYKLTLVQSGPGYGKSTALSTFFRTHSLAFCWYTPGEHDDDLFTFYHYLIQAIRTIAPAFGEELLELLANADLYSPEKDIINLCEAFINELCTLSGEMVLVIDDYYLVEHSHGIDSFLRYFLQHMPEQIHLVLSSRTRPFPSLLPTLKLKGDLLEIGESDLAFSLEDIEVLFSDYYDYPLRPEEVAYIYKRTEGWAIAVQLFWQRLLYEQEQISAVMGNEAEPMEDLFHFLAMEVFQKQPAEIQEFLEQTSILEEMGPDACDRIFGRQDSRRVLDQLCGESLFIVHLGEGQYRYHALFRDFLRSQLQKKSEARSVFHHQAACYFQANQQHDQALFHLAQIGDWEAYALLLHSCGAEMIAKGQLESLLEKLACIPEIIKNRHFLLWIYEGDVYRYRSSYDQALACYQKGERLAAAAGDARCQSFALEGQARIYLDTIQPVQAEILLDKAVSLVERLERLEHEHVIRLYSLKAENLVNLGRSNDAESWYERCRSLQHDFQEDLLEARMHLRTGRLKQAKKLIEQMKQGESRQKAAPLPRSHRETAILLSLVESLLGNPEEAKQLAQSGMVQGIQMKAPFVEACGWMRMGHAAQLLAKYDFSVAQECYQTSLAIMERINVSRGRAEPLMGLCLLYAREGQHDLAMKFGQEALEETEKVKDEWLSALIRLCMGIATYYSDRQTEAIEIFKECQERFLTCGDSYGMTVTLLWLAMISYQQERHDLFLPYMDRFLNLAQTGRYDFLLQKRTLAGPRNIKQMAPLLIEAQKQKIQPHYVNHLLTGLGLEQMTYHPGYTLRIETLGGFKVWLGDAEIKEKDWQRGKAKELFQLLVNKRQQLVSKEEIISVLFRDLDEKTANRDFKVVLNALNTTLEPQRRARTTPFFIQRHGTSYGLNLASGLEIDAVEFESLVRAGLIESDPQQALSALEKGLELYKGDYLPDRRFEDWSIEERERLQVLFLRGAERLAKCYLERNAYEKAIHWCEKILLSDLCWEEAYRLLMLCHFKLNNRNQAIKCYQKCSTVLERELGVKPMQSTRDLYETMLRTNVTHL